MMPPTDKQDEVEGLNEDNQNKCRHTYAKIRIQTSTGTSDRISKPTLTYITDTTGNIYEVNFNSKEISNEVMTFGWITSGVMQKL